MAQALPYNEGYRATNLANMLERSSSCAQISSGNLTLPEPQFQILDKFQNQSRENPETDIYFYHGDHLDSSSWITDASRAVNQHLQYLPFGESFIDQRGSTGHDIRFKFTGKEQDAETGYLPIAIGIGARYYDSGLSVWLSVDPLSDKYPSMSPYAYCNNNPINYTDTWGLAPDGGEGEGGGDDYVYGPNESSNSSNQDLWYYKSGETSNRPKTNVGLNYSNNSYSYTNSSLNVTGMLSAERELNRQRFLQTSPYLNSSKNTTNSSGNTNNIGDYLGIGSFTFGMASWHVGTHMKSVSRFAPMLWNDGTIYRSALRGFRFGPIPGSIAVKLGAGFKIGGGILGGFGIGYSIYQVSTGKIGEAEGGFDIGFGVIGYFGYTGMFVSGYYMATKYYVFQLQGLSQEQDYPLRYLPGKF